MRPDRLLVVLCGFAVGVGGLSVSLPDLEAASAAAQHGNGVAADAPGAIIADAHAAIDSASTVHVSGVVINNGARLTIDIEAVKGRGGYGTFTAVRGSTTARYQLVVMGTQLYINGNKGFYEAEGSTSATAARLEGHWFKESATSGDNAVLASLLSARTLFTGLLALHGTLEKLKTTTILRQAVVPVTNANKTAIVYVATTGNPYPVEIAVPGPKGGALAVDRINQPVQLAAPGGATSIPTG